MIHLANILLNLSQKLQRNFEALQASSSGSEDEVKQKIEEAVQTRLKTVGEEYESNVSKMRNEMTSITDAKNQLQAKYHTTLLSK